MDILFLHNNFPAQYRNLAQLMAADKRNRIVFGTQRKEGELKGITKVYYEPHRKVAEGIHRYLRSTEEAVLNGQAAYRSFVQLKKAGFMPAVICAHSGWGPSLYVKDLWPDAKLISYFEWFYDSSRSADTFLGDALNEDDVLQLRTRNAPILMDWAACDRGLCPTAFQLSTFPEPMRGKISLLHDGVDTDFFTPDPEATLTLGPRVFRRGDEVVTYVARGMEPYRGFPTFMRALEIAQRRRPNLHAIIVGEDRVAYGRRRADGKGWKDEMLGQVAIDPERTHFTGYVPLTRLREILRISAAHIYYTAPFVLSWSMLESMAAGVLLLASDTAPVREVVKDGENGLLADFFSPDGLADRLDAVLDDPGRHAPLREAARRTILERFALKDLLPRHAQMIEDLAAGRPIPETAT